MLLSGGEMVRIWGRLIGLQGRRYKLLRSGNQEGNGGVGVLVKE